MLLTGSVVVGAGVVIVCYSAFSASDIPAGVAEVHLEVFLAILDGMGQTTYKVGPPDETLDSVDAGWTVGIDGVIEGRVELNLLHVLDRNHNHLAGQVLPLVVQFDLTVVCQTRDHGHVVIHLSNKNSENGHRLLLDIAASLIAIIGTQLDILRILLVVERGIEPWELRVRPSLDTKKRVRRKDHIGNGSHVGRRCVCVDRVRKLECRGMKTREAGRGTCYLFWEANENKRDQNSTHFHHTTRSVSPGNKLSDAIVPQPIATDVSMLTMLVGCR